MHLGLANAVCAALLAVLALAAGRWLRRPALTHCLWLLVLLKLVTPPLFSLHLPWLPAEETSEPVVIQEPAPPPPVVAALPDRESYGPPTVDDVWIEMEKTRARNFLLQQDRALLADPSGKNELKANSPELLFVQLAALEQPVGAASRAAPEAPLVNEVPLGAQHLSEEAASSAAPVSLAPLGSRGLLMLLGSIWLTGSLLWFVRAVRRLARFQRLLRLVRPAPDHVQALAARVAGQLGLRRCPEVSLLPCPLPPMVWGAFGPARVLLPARLLERLDEDQLATLLAHELVHVRRGDHWVRRLEFLALGLFWWYPLAWWARARLQAEEEDCCDAWVVETFPALTYASAIVETVDFLSEPSSDLAPVPALASGLGRIDALKRRLTLILGEPAPKRLNLAGRLAVVCLALGLLPLLPTLAHSEKEQSGQAGVKEEAAKDPLSEVADEALALRPNPLNLTGGDNEVAALAVSPDGKYLAAGTGTVNRPGEVRVWTIPDHKEVLIYATAQGVATVAFSPDGKHLASTGYDSQAVIREFPSGKVVAVLPLDEEARLAYSPDGKLLVTATAARTIKVWNALTGAEMVRLESESVRWYCIAYSPDGKYVATGGGDLGGQGIPNEVTIWDTKTWKPAGKLQGHTQAVMCVTFSPDSKTIASGGDDATARLWRLDGRGQFKPVGTLEGHENRVKAVTFTPDGKTLATASHDGSVRLWDVAKLVPLTRLDGHVPPVRSIAVSPDGKQLYTGGAQRILKVWDIKSHTESASYELAPQHPEGEAVILAMVYSPDGRLLATAHENGLIVLRSASTGELVRTLDPAGGQDEAATCLVFSRDSKTLFTGSADRTVRLWDVETGKTRASLTGHTSWVYALALAPDGKTLASAGYDKVIRLWGLDTLKEKATLSGHKAAVRALAFAPDGKTLASGAGDHSIKLWDLDSLKEKATLTGHEGTVRALTYSPAGLLASGAEDATVRLWDATGASRAVLTGHNNKVTGLVFSPRGRYLVSASMDGTVRLWDTTSGQSLQMFRGHNDALTCLAWAPDGRFLVTAGFDREVKLWMVTAGVLRMLTGHTGPVQAASFSPDGKYILSCSAWPMGDKTIRLWDTRTGKEIRKFEGHSGPVGYAVFSPDGKRALSSSFDKTVRLWDVETGQTIRVLTGHESEVPRVVFSPDGKRAVSGSHDKTVRLWDLETGACLHVLNGHSDFVRTVAFTQDGKRVYSGARDSSIRIWDVAKGTELQRIDLQPKAWIERLALSPDGKRLVVAHGNAVRILDAETGKQLRQLDGHQFGVITVAWSPDGKAVLSAGYDGTARLWEVETGRELHVFRGHSNWVWAANFSPDGRRIVTAGGGASNGPDYVAGNDFAIRLWPVQDFSPMAGRLLKFPARPEK
jgi:WD40 repeat protein/beta-lactamase regulating signal transducer with metallopeptidase domain